MKKIQAFGYIIEGKLHLYNRPVFNQFIQEVYEASEVKVTLEYGNIRSLDQNAYIWGGIVQPLWYKLHYEMGWDFSKEEVYDFLQRKFCKREAVSEQTGETMEVVTPLKTMTTDQFSEKIDQIRAWIHERIDIYVQTPAEYYGMTEHAYSKWREGDISKADAMRLSNKS